MGRIAVFFKVKVLLLLETFVGKWVKQSMFAEIKTVNPHAVCLIKFSTTLICLALEDMVRKWLTRCKLVVSCYNGFWSARKSVIINWHFKTRKQL